VPNQTTLSTLRASLEEERDDLVRGIKALETGTDASLDFDENFADSGQVAAEQGENKVLVASLRDQLTDVEKALAKMDDGGYGTCERCGEAIAEPRLEAMPATRYCINHA
jgi:RNA polymerase-binding transcription factor DksA